MDHWQRIFAYVSASLMIGLAVAVFTHTFFKLAAKPGATGYITLCAFGLAFLSLSFALNRRFVLKSNRSPAFNYLIAFFIVAPTLLWAFTKDEGLGNALFTFTATTVFAAFLGTYFGMQHGLAKRDEYLRNYYEHEEDDLPDELKRPHEKLNKN